jgi:hypothetical protein
MEEQIESVLDTYYNYVRPEITDVSVLEASPNLGIYCIRWRHDGKTITVKSIITDSKISITQLI